MNFLHFISFKDPLAILLRQNAKLIFIKGKLSGRLLIKEKFAVSKTNYFHFCFFFIWIYRLRAFYPNGYVKLQMNAGLFKLIIIVRTTFLSLKLKIFRNCFLQVSYKILVYENALKKLHYLDQGAWSQRFSSRHDRRAVFMKYQQ